MRDYTRQIAKYWPTILRAWQGHAEKRPIIECDLAGKKVRAYPAAEYIDGLSERTREATRREFARTMAEGGIMVFILDSKNRVLQSYSFPDVGSADKSKVNKVSKETARPSQRRKGR